MEARKHGCPVQEVKFPVEECRSAGVQRGADTVMTVETSRGGTCHGIKIYDYMMGLSSLWGLIDFTLVAPPVTCQVCARHEITWEGCFSPVVSELPPEPMYRLCGCKQVFLAHYWWHPVILMAVIWPLTDYWPHGHTPVWAMRGSKLISAIWGSFLHFSTFLLLSCYCPHIAHILIRFGFDRWLNSTPLWCNLKTQGVTIIFLHKNIFPMTLYQ